MNYEFHVGDYVKTRAGYIGYIDNVSDLGDGNIVVRVRCEDEDLVPFKVNDLNVTNNFLRIGAYDFTKKEKKKIEYLEKDLPVEGRIKDKTVEFKQYFSDGEYVKFVYNGKMIDKINELVDAVNKLMEKKK